MVQGAVGVEKRTVSNTAGPIGWAASGTFYPVSGEVGALSGPWMIEQQWMTIAYTRVPRIHVSSTTPGLSAYNVNYKVDQTTLEAIITAHYERKKVFENHSVSSYVQTQRFSVEAVSADPYGNTYGTLNASTLGPQGTILTMQPWYSRRPWNANDTSTICDVYGSNFATGASSLTNHCTDLYSTDQVLSWKDFDRMSILSTEKGALTASFHDPAVFGRRQAWLYLLGGQYSVAQESLARQIEFIDQCGSLATGWQDSLGLIPQLYSIPALVWGTEQYANIVPSEQCSEYSNTRHNYA